MKILIVTTDFLPNVSGIATLSYEQAAGLSRLGCDVKVFTSTQLSQHSSAEPRQSFTVETVQTDDRPVLRIKSLFQALRKAVITWRPDLIWCTNYRGFGLPVLLVSLLSRIPYGIYFHGTELITEHKNLLRRTILGRIARRARYVCCNSKNTQGLISALYGIQSHVITPGVHVPQPEEIAAADLRLVRQDWFRNLANHSRKASEPFVLAVACRVTRQKGLFTAVEAISLLPTDLRERLIYVIAGSGPDSSELQKYIAQMELSGNVLLAGPVSRKNLFTFLAAADGYLQPSEPVGDFLESFGISFLEAQAVGLPCIGTRWGGIPEAVRENQTALLVDVKSPTQLSQAIIEVMTDQDWRMKGAQNGRHWASENTWDYHVSNLGKVLDV